VVALSVPDALISELESAKLETQSSQPRPSFKPAIVTKQVDHSRDWMRGDSHRLPPTRRQFAEPRYTEVDFGLDDDGPEAA
jgi:hypothetical protein